MTNELAKRLVNALTRADRLPSEEWLSELTKQDRAEMTAIKISGSHQEAYERIVAWVAKVLDEHPSDDAEPLDETWLRSVGFKRHKLEGVLGHSKGSPFSTLYIVEGYSEGKIKKNYWACVGKYTTIENAIGTCAHFDKRLFVRADVRLLCKALGIELKEGKVDCERKATTS